MKKERLKKLEPEWLLVRSGAGTLQREIQMGPERAGLTTNADKIMRGQ